MKAFKIDKIMTKNFIEMDKTHEKFIKRDLRMIFKCYMMLTSLLIKELQAIL